MKIQIHWIEKKEEQEKGMELKIRTRKEEGRIGQNHCPIRAQNHNNVLHNNIWLEEKDKDYCNRTNDNKIRKKAMMLLAIENNDKINII